MDGIQLLQDFGEGQRQVSGYAISWALDGAMGFRSTKSKPQQLECDEREQSCHS
jgi:hypothetical protein